MGRCSALQEIGSPQAAARPTAPAGVSAEALERRWLLSVSVTDFKRGPLARIGTDLASVFVESTANRGRNQTAAPGDPLLHTQGGRVNIEAFAKRNGAALARQIRTLKATNLRTTANAVSASIPINQLARLAGLPALQFARPVRYVLASGSVNSQGDAAMAADIARATYGLSGAGVKVGIVSDSFNTGPGAIHYAQDIASGDLPANVQVLSDTPGGTDEGRAMAQVIHDSAPSAALAFATGDGGQVAFANNIKSLRDAGARVIVDDLTYLDEPMFQDGLVAQAVDNVVASGVSYFSAAGNYARNSYESAWRNGNTSVGTISSAPGAPHFYGGNSFDFDPGAGVIDTQGFSLGNGQSILMSFQWDSPYFSAGGGAGTPNDLDIYVLNAAGTQVVGGSAGNNLGGDPTEVFQFTNSTGAPNQFKLMLVWNAPAGGPQPGYLKWVEFVGAASGYAFATNSGTAFGHSNAAGAESVAAAYYNFSPGSPTVENFSSAGGVPILFGAAGNRLGAPLVRQSPDITAPDGGDTTFFGADLDANGKPNFRGTSAAASGAAAVAALLLQKSPSLTPAQVYAALQNTATDMDDPTTSGFDTGVDARTGYGMIRADAAVASLVGTISGTVYQDNNGNGVMDGSEVGIVGVTVFYDADNNASLDGGEISAVSNGAGGYTLSNVPAGTSEVIRAITPADFVATSSAVTVNLGGGGTVAGTKFGLFPIAYTAAAGNDSYTLRINPSATSSVEILVNGVPTYTAAKSIIPVLWFNLGGGDDLLTVSYANGNPIPTNGVNYDGGQNTAAGDSLLVSGSSSGETFTLANLFIFPANGSISVEELENATVTGSGGNDTLLVESGFPANVAWDGGTGTNILTWTGAPSPETINVSTGLISNGTYTTTYAGTQTLNLNPLSFNDVINVSLAAGAPPLTITATTSPNTINLNAGASASPVTVLGNAGSTKINIASGYASPVSLSGPGSNNAIVVNATNGNDTIAVTSTSVTAGVTSVTYSNLTLLTINALDGNDTINITSAPPAATTVSGGLGNDTLNVNAALASSGSLTVFNGGTTVSDQDSLNINAGTFQLAGDPQTGTANLTVNDNANLIFTAATSGGVNARRLAALNIGANNTATVNRPTLHANRAVLVLGALSINPAAKLDLGDSDMIVRNGNLSAINALLTSGFASGLWTGNGITSAAARADTTRRTALGVLKNADADGNPLYGIGRPMGLFDGQDPTAVDVLVKYTWYGDANLTGKVDGADYARIDNGFNLQLSGWSNGEFTFDGSINSADYSLIDNAYNTQGATVL